MHKRTGSPKQRVECECAAQGKLEAYTNFICDLAESLGVAESVNVKERSMNLRAVKKHDVVEMARNLLKRYGDYEDGEVH